MSKETGGPAFPFEYHNNTNKTQASFFTESYVYPGGSEQYAGMTLRDYFAAKAMQGILSNQGMIDNVTQDAAEWTARGAYQIADAMLKARNQ